MLSKIVKALEIKISEAKKSGKSVVDLEMKKKVIDKQENGLNDMLAIYFPTNFDKEFFEKTEFRVSEYSQDSFRKFDTLENVAEWIVKTYC